MKILSKLDNTRMIEETADKRFVSDTKISEWDGKETTTGSQNKANQAEQNAKTYADVGLADKVDKVSGKGLSTNDYTTAEKTKLAEIKTATLAEAIAGNSNTVYMTPLRVRNYVFENTLSSASLIALLDLKVNTEEGKGLSTEDYTSADKTKLSGIATGANNYTHPATHPSSMITGLPTSLPADGGNADTVGGFTVGVNVPANAKFTDTITTINGKTGAITKADIAALGIPTQDTVVDISGKADKTYVDNKVKTDVPLNAKFTDTVYTHPTTAGNKHIPTGGSSGQVLKYNASGTATWQDDSDTITTINGKTGTIAKADIVALGIPAQDTVVDISGKADKTYVDSKVQTDVPLNAKFTDTVYSHPSSHPASMITESSTKRFVSDSEKLAWNSKADTDTVTTINGKTGAISKADIVALGIPASDTNTTYTEITTAEIDAGTASTRRTISGRRVKYILDKISSMISAAIGALTKSSVGLGNVDNTSDANKPVSTATQTALDGKVNNSQVLTNVPSGAKFTDTITTVNGKTGAISKADITMLGIPAKDTTYIEITTAEIDSGATATGRLVSGRRLKYLLDKIVALFPTKTSELTNDSGFLTRWPTWSEVTNKPHVIEESGSNPNGQYIRFSDGTLIMTMTTTAVYAWGKAVVATISLPSSAINTNYQVQLSYGYDLPDAIRGKTTIHARNKTTSSFGIVMQTQDGFFNETNTADVRIDCMIYGRWK